MKTLLGVLALFVIMAASANATVCPSTPSTTWQDYLNLGTSCTSADGNITFSNFDFATFASAGVTAVPATSISVSLLANGLSFTIAGMTVNGSNLLLDANLFYSVSSTTVSFSGLGLTFNGVISGAGNSSVAETYCTGSAQDLKSNPVCSPENSINVTNPPVNLTNSASFGSTLSLSVEKAINVNTNGGTGIATISTVSNTFTTSGLGVPEPATLGLVGAGLLGLGLLRRRLKA